MSKKTRGVGATLLATASILALSACGMNAAVTGPTGKAAGTGKIKGTITFQTDQESPGLNDYFNGIVSAFEAKYPGTTVKWSDIPTSALGQKTNADAVAGSLPDVIDLDTASLAPIARAGLVVDMAVVVPDVEKTFTKKEWDGFQYGKTKVAALPWYANTPILIMNKKILQAAGLGNAPDPDSYTKLIEESAIIAKKTGVAGFQPTISGMPNMLFTSGVPLVNSNSTKAVVNTPAAVEFVKQLAGLYKNGGIPASSVTAQQRAEIQTFEQGQTAFLEAGGSRLTIIKENAPDVYSNVDVGKPLGAATKRTWVDTHGIAVPKNSKNLATALAFAKFLTNSSNQLALSKVDPSYPSTRAGLDDPFFTAKSTGDVIAKARSIAATSLQNGTTITLPMAVDGEYEQVLWSALQPAIIGSVTPEEALASAQTALTKILAGRQK